MPVGCIAERGRKEPSLEEGTHNLKRGCGTRGTGAGKPETAEGATKGSTKGRKSPEGSAAVMWPERKCESEAKATDEFL